MDHLIYTGWLRELSLPELFSPENRTERRPHQCLSASEGRVSGSGARLCSVGLSRRTRGNGQKVEERKIHLDVRMVVQVLCTLEFLLREAVESPSLEIFQNCLHTILCIVLWDDPA